MDATQILQLESLKHGWLAFILAAIVMAIVIYLIRGFERN